MQNQDLKPAFALVGGSGFLEAFLVETVWTIVYVIVPSDAAVFYTDSLEEFLVLERLEAREMEIFFTSKTFSSLLVNVILSKKSGSA